MANKKINDLAVAGTVSTTMQLETDIGGVTANRVTAAQIKTFTNNGEAGGKTIEGGTLTTETLLLRNNSVDNLGIDVNGDGSLTVNALNYETLVTAAADIPNKKYVDDSIPVAVKDPLSVSFDGETDFTLSSTPISASVIKAVVNHFVYERVGVDFNFSGTSFTWLDPDGVTLKTTDQFTVIYNDIGGGAIKSHLSIAEPNLNYGNRRVRNIGSTGSFRLPFVVPKDFTGTLTLKAIFYPTSGAGGAGKDIDISGEYTNGAGDSNTQYTILDTTTTYNTGVDDTRTELDITTLFPNLAAGSDGAILWDNNSIGGSLGFIGLEVTNT